MEELFSLFINFSRYDSFCQKKEQKTFLLKFCKRVTRLCPKTHEEQTKILEPFGSQIKIVKEILTFLLSDLNSFLLSKNKKKKNNNPYSEKSTNTFQDFGTTKITLENYFLQHSTQLIIKTLSFLTCNPPNTEIKGIATSFLTLINKFVFDLQAKEDDEKFKKEIEANRPVNNQIENKNHQQKKKQAQNKITKVDLIVTKGKVKKKKKKSKQKQNK